MVFPSKKIIVFVYEHLWSMKQFSLPALDQMGKGVRTTLRSAEDATKTED